MFQDLDGRKFVVNVVKKEVEDGCPVEYVLPECDLGDGLSSASNGLNYSTNSDQSRKKYVR